MESGDSADRAEVARNTFNLIRRVTRRKTADARSRSDVESKLLGLCTGHETNPPSRQALCFLNYLEAKIAESDFNVTLHQHLRPDFLPRYSQRERAMWMICKVLEIYRAENDISIQRAVRLLYTDQVFLQQSEEQNDENLKILIFSILGWTTALFEPSDSLDSNSFVIRNRCPGSPLRTSVMMNKAQRPLDELLRAFGDLLPKKTATESDGDDVRLTFQVSYLNAATLKTIGHISICWVDSLSSHLMFDPTGLTLCLFRIPAICEAQRSDSSILSM